MADLSVDRARLVKYLKTNAEQIVNDADIDIDADAIQVADGTMQFMATVRLRIDGIPINEVEVKK
jgi:hypothetical protein